MVELPDLRVVKLVRQAEQERQARLKAEHAMRGLKGQLTLANERLAAERMKTTDATPKPPEPTD